MFPKHTEDTAPESAAAVLAGARERYGFVPNLAAYLAEAPPVLGAVLSASQSFDQSSFTAKEQQTVLLTVSALNACSYCRTVHTGLGRESDLDPATLEAILETRTPADPRLGPLFDFTRKIVEKRGRVSEADLGGFFDAGFTRAQVFEVLLGVALKTLTNYSNGIVGAEPNEEFVAMAAEPKAA